MKHVLALRARSTVLLAAAIAILFALASPARAVSSTIVISQVYGGGGNAGATYRNDFIELYNRGTTTVSIAGWSVQYTSSAGTTWQSTPLTGSLAPGQYYLVQEAQGTGGTTNLPTPDAIGTIPMSGTAGKVVLVNNSTLITAGTSCPSGATIVDIVGFGVGTNCFEGSGPTPAPSNTTSVSRGANGCTETDNNASDFSAGAVNPRNSSTTAGCVVSTPPSGTGAANPAVVPAGGTTLLTVTVTPGTGPTSTGLTVTADLTAIGGSATQQFFDDGTNGDVSPGNNVFSYQTSVAAGTSGGDKSLPATINDAQARSGAASISLSVTLSPPSGDLVISQVYGGGGNAGATFTNDFIEIYNRGNATINLTGYSVQYGPATLTTWSVTPLSGSIGPGRNYLVQEAAGAGGTTPLPTPDAVGTIAMAAGAAKVALVSSTSALSGACPSSAAILDFIGYGGTANCYEGSGAAPTLTNTTAGLRNANGCTDTNNNASDISSGAPNPRNTAAAAHFCNGPTNPTGVGSATPSAVDSGQTSLLKVAVTPGSNPPSSGLTVTANLSSIGGSATQAFFDDGSNGDVTPGDNLFSFLATVTGTGGVKTLPFSIADAELRGGSGSISLTINPALIAIHDIQGAGTTSPHTGELVATIGIVTGVKTNGFFIQTNPGFEDADTNTSEGIFVFTSSAPPAAAAAGNEVKVTGTVQEFIPGADVNSPPTTEIGGSLSVILQSTGNPLPAAITLTAGDTSPAGSIEQLEKYEGMRVHVDSLTAIAPTQGSVSEANATSTSNGVFYGVITGVARPFREPGIQTPDPVPAGPCCVPIFDANPERLRVDSDGLVGATGLDVTTGAVVTNLTGPLDYAFRTYTIDPDPAITPLVTGNLPGAIPVPAPSSSQFTVASFNTERFFDTVNDPGISDVALTPTAFNNRLNKASLAIRNVLMAPDILGVEEMENLTTLQALAAKVNNDAIAAGQPNPNYQAYLEEGNDPGGIDVGFLVKGAPRVNVVDVTQYNKNETYIDPNSGFPALLNDRPSLILRATVQNPVGAAYPITVIVNHLRSLNGVDDPADGNRVRTKRRAQAESLANLVQARQTADPDEHIVLVGDFNAFEVNDGYVDSIGTIRGTPAPCGEVVLCSTDLVNPDLQELAESVPAADRYSYSFDGNAQVLDHELMTQNLLTRFDGLHYARNDADFSESFRNDPNRPERISDHDMPVAYFNFPPEADLSITKGDAPDPVTTGGTLTYTLTVSNAGPNAAANVTVTDTLPSEVAFVSCSSTGSGACGGTGNSRTVTFASLASGATETITLTASVTCALANGTTISNTATIGSDTTDPDSSDNSSTTTTTASNPAPSVTAPTANPATLKPANHKMVLVTVAYGVSDNCGAVACALTVSSNEPVNGSDDGDTAPDWQIVDANHVYLRAERSGTGTGRIYTITVTCTDSAGNSTVRTVNVTVPLSPK